MTGFLTSLAGMALGVSPPGAIRLSLPPRFAPASASGWIEAAAEGRAAVGAPPGGPAIEPASRAAPVAAADREPPPAERPPARLQAERPERTVTEAAKGPASGPASAGMPPVRQVHPEPIRPVAVPSARALRETPLGAEDRAPLARLAEPLPPRWVAGIVTVAPQAPLSAAAVASRAEVERDTRPVVHVTIDRIDIRAPRDAAKPEPAQKRAKAQPQISLDDYLGVRP